MSGIDNSTRVANVGSPSSNFEVTLDLNGDGRNTPLVGAMLALENKMGEGSELALGTVTEVTTRNRWHEDSAFRGASSEDGQIAGLSGDFGDTRSATIRLQAAWRCDYPGAPWTPSGPSLRMSPATGAGVVVVDDALVSELTAGTDDLHYMGRLAGTSDVRLPFNMPDFSGPMGAFHSGCYGLSGAGKALHLDTPIPTPSGWTRMGDLRDGDIVFGEDGQPCRVVKAHDVLYDRECYEVVFSDGSVIVADGEHLWETQSIRARARQSLVKGPRIKRRPLLPESVRNMLVAEAEKAKPLDLITISEVAALPGVTISKRLLREIGQRVGSAGTVRVFNQFERTESDTSRTFPSRVWPKTDLLEALIETAKSPTSRLTEEQILALKEALYSSRQGEWVSMPDVARLLGRPPRNAGLMKKLKSLGVPSEKRYVEQAVHLADRTIERESSVAVVYPKASLLRAVAEHTANFRGDQRHLLRHPQKQVVTTKQIAETLRAYGNHANHAIPVAGALQLPPADLLVDPYVLGLWLGDGDSVSAGITTVDQEILDSIKGSGFGVSEYEGIRYGIHVPAEMYPPMSPDVCIVCKGAVEKTSKAARGATHTVCRPMLSFAGMLKVLGVFGNKHIPAQYLRGSIEQRRALLAGLLDTDGTVSPNGGIHFDNTNKRLATQVRELALSLGYRATVTSKRAMLNGRDCGIVYRVAWTTNEPVFRLSRKAEAQRDRTKSYNASKNMLRYITDVRKVDSVPVRCITVDSPNHLYLAGESMIPTHNTQAVSLMLASQFRHENMACIIVDPQGQWSSEQGMVFSVQGFASELGRDVRVRRISTDLKLTKDATLFTDLLTHTQLMKELSLKSTETAEVVFYEMQKAMRDVGEWTEKDADVLLRALLNHLTTEAASERIYVTPDNRRLFVDRINNILSDANSFTNVLNQFAPIHNLFQDANPSGGQRHSLWAAISEVFERPSGVPAPLLILDMSSAPLPGMDEKVTEAMRTAQTILEKDSVKAAVLRNLFGTLKTASEDKFRSGKNLNTMVVLDEAWRYAAPPGRSDEPEIAALSRDLAGYARDTRKFGIGWFYISQSTRSINLDIWDQMTVRFFGYGLSGADLDKMGEVVDDRNALRLYRMFGNPRSTGVYPFLVSGPVSPLAANATPLTLHTYTNFDDFRADNHRWIKAIREKLGLPVASGLPVAPRGSSAGPRPKVKSVRNKRDAIIDSNQAARENREAVGVKDAKGFADPLSSIDDEVPF